MCNESWVNKINEIINTLGSRPWHLPVLLAWSVLHGQKSSLPESSQKNMLTQYGKLALRAVKGNVFQYLKTALNNPAVQVQLV